VKLLTSEANPLFRGWLRLAGKPRSARDLGQTLAEGLHLAQAALDAKWPVAAALLRRRSSGSGIDRVIDQLPAAVERFQLSAPLFDRLSPVEHGVGLILVVPVRAASVQVAWAPARVASAWRVSVSAKATTPSAPMAPASANEMMSC